MADTSLSGRLRGAIVSAGTPGSLAHWTRAKRWKMFAATFPDIHRMRVLDLGGTVRTWTQSPVRPREVVIVNLAEQPPAPGWIVSHIGDACVLPEAVASERFDLVYCNSVIEHVGGHAQRSALAASVHVSAPRHWVQTPYRYFPIEPHWIFPAFQFLPVNCRALVTRTWRVGNRRTPWHAADAAVSSVLGVELLSKTEMHHYFPRSQLVGEHFAGMVKSLIAVLA